MLYNLLFPKDSYGFFHAFKQKYGSNLNSRNISPARAEVYCKAILHNIALRIAQLLGQTRVFK